MNTRSEKFKKIKQAIDNIENIVFSFGDNTNSRYFTPHKIGLRRGKEALLGCQYAGYTSDKPKKVVRTMYVNDINLDIRVDSNTGTHYIDSKMTLKKPQRFMDEVIAELDTDTVNFTEIDEIDTSIK